MCRELFLLFGMSEMVIIFSILQALGISNKNRTEDINSTNIRLRRNVPMSLEEEEDCSQLILLLEFILFTLILVWLMLIIFLLLRYIDRN